VNAVGRVAKQVGSRGYYASVSVSFTPATERSVTVATEATRWQLPHGWSDAAANGAAIGMELAGACGSCLIARVHGMACDTSPGLVMIAAVRGAWAAIPFAPGATLAEAVEACILRGHQLSPEEIRTELLAAQRLTEPESASRPPTASEP